MSELSDLQKSVQRDIRRIRTERKKAMSNKVYNILKWSALVGLPALAVFWLSIAPTWGLPYGDQVGKTLVALDVLLGTLVGVSSAVYAAKKGK